MQDGDNDTVNVSPLAVASMALVSGLALALVVWGSL